jgi:hypothetical protein
VSGVSFVMLILSKFLGFVLDIKDFFCTIYEVS